MKLKLTIAISAFIFVSLSFTSYSKAGTVTSEKPLGGLSFYLNQYAEETNQAYYPEDVELLAQVMFHENYSNGEKVMRYTGAVVLNRVAKHYADGTVKGVLYQKGQYSTVPKFFTKEIPHSVYLLALKLVKEGTSDVPKNVVYQAMFPQGSGIWDQFPASYNPDHIEYFCYE